MSENIKEMSVWDHIFELRGRLLKAVIALAITTIASFMFAQQLIEILKLPVQGQINFIAIEVTEPVSVFMQVSLLSGVIFAFPIIFYQLMAFVMPGLTKEERRSLLLFIPFATILFIGGVAFTYFVMLPSAIPFLSNVIANIQSTPRISNYIQFVTNLMFWIGVSFETPLVMYILAKFRIVSASMLLRQWRFAIVIIALIAAVVTPTPDPVNMGLLMTPLFLLYLLSILLAKIARPKE